MYSRQKNFLLRAAYYAAVLILLWLAARYLLVWLLGGILLICLGHWLLKGKGRRIAALAAAVCLLLSTGAHFGFRFNVTSVQSVAAGSGIVTLLKQNGRCALLLNGTAASWKEALYLLSNEAVTSLDAVSLV